MHTKYERITPKTQKVMMIFRKKTKMTIFHIFFTNNQRYGQIGLPVWQDFPNKEFGRAAEIFENLTSDLMKSVSKWRF